jgi:hypothetical protein
VSKEKSGPPGLHLYVVSVDKQWRKRMLPWAARICASTLAAAIARQSKGAPTIQLGAPSCLSRLKSRLQTRCSLAIFVVLKVSYLLLYLDTLPS